MGVEQQSAASALPPTNEKRGRIGPLEFIHIVEKLGR